MHYQCGVQQDGGDLLHHAGIEYEARLGCAGEKDQKMQGGYSRQTRSTASLIMTACKDLAFLSRK